MTQLEHAEWLEAQGRNEEAARLLAEAREIFGGSGRRRGSNGAGVPASRRWPGDLRQLRCRERGGEEVLHRLRHAARGGLSIVRRVPRRHRALLRGVRRAARRSARTSRAGCACPPAAERRLVSVLFADLVGFTSASEERDAEDTRELLSRYFETAQRLIERYGGTVEKFIGDAVMAVWGTPVANEDDAERAVRAALDLVAAVPELTLRSRPGRGY